MSINPRVTAIQEAEEGVKLLTAQFHKIRSDALQDGVIDKEEQADLDRVSAKLEQLETIIREQRAILKRNRAMWDALDAARKEFDNRLAELQEAKWEDLGKLEGAAAEIVKCEGEQRWEEATKLLEAARSKMATAYQKYLQAKADAEAGEGNTADPVTVDSIDADKAKYDVAKAAYQKAMTALERHAQAGDPAIAGDITAIKTKATAAETDATGGDYAAAYTKMSPLAAECAAAEDKAHDLAHFNAVRAHRQSLVNNPDPAALTTDAAIDDLKTEIDTLFAGAQTDATAGKFGDGIAKLDRIPILHEQRRALNDRRTKYLWYVNNIQTLIGQVDGAPATDRAPVQATIDRFKADFEAAKYANTNNYATSSGLMDRINSEFAALRTVLRSAAAYTAALTAFDAQYTVLEPHAGRVAVEEFFQQRKADRAQAVSEAGMTKFPTAIQLLQRVSAGDWTAQKAIADAYVVFDGKKTTAEALIATVKAMPGTADGIARAEASLALAISHAVAGDIPAAEASLADATARANEAKAASEALAALDAMHDTGALDGAADDFAAALLVYTNMRANVASKVTSEPFTALFAAADAFADAAQTEAAKAAPDAAAVRKNLDDGIAALKELLPKILAHAGFTAHLATARTLVDTTLPPLSIDDCIKPAIDACTALLTDAENLAKAPGYDFAGAETKVQDATKRGLEAQANANLYTTAIKPGVTAIQAAVTAIGTNNANVQTLLTARTTRLNAFVTDIAADIAAEKFKDAQSKANEGVAVANAVAQDVQYCVNIDTNHANWVTSRLPQIQGGQPAVAAALAKTNKLLADHQANLNAGAFGAAWNTTNQLYWSIQEGIDALALATPYNAAQTAARAALDALTTRRSPSSEAALAAFEDRYTAAVTLAAEPQYAVATQRMTALTAEVNAYMATADAYKTYDPARDKAAAKLAEAQAHSHRVAIETMLGLLQDKFNAAEDIARDGEPARAQKMMEEVEASAADCIKEADFAESCTEVAEALGDSASENSGPTFVHIGLAEAGLALQRGREHADIAQQELADAEAELTKAKDDSVDPGDQTEALRKSLDLIASAGDIISQNQLLESALADARQRITQLRSHAQAAYLDTLLKDAEAQVGVISARAVNLAALPGCSSDLEALMEKLRDYGPKMDAHAEYVVLRPKPEVEPRLAVLEAHDHAYAIQKQIDAMRRKLDEAARLSAEYDPHQAVERLKEVETLGLSAQVLADMRANTPPSPADLKKIMEGPGGPEELDAMIDALEPDAQRAVLKVAFEARFGCSLQNFAGVDASGNPINPIAAGAQDGPNIKRFYEIMSDLPDHATLDSDSFRIFTEIESGQGSYYSGSTKDVVMREGDGALSSAYTFGAEAQVGQVDPGCEPANEDPVSFFSWNTLHEVGHAVDDQHGFMSKNQSGAAYGGWTEYGNNVTPIATVLAGHFKYDQRYIHQSMLQKLPTATAPGDVAPGTPQPNGCSAEEWESRRVAFVTWLAQVREPRNPWDSNSVAQRVAIGGVVYHEAYTGTWVSYQLAARSKGMTGYQFRAPGEWFSELYAAFHSGKLKPTHPAVAWLETLNKPA